MFKKITFAVAASVLLLASMVFAMPSSAHADTAATSTLDIFRPITFPINGTSTFSNSSFSTTTANGGRIHLAIDIIADKMTPLVAAIDGRVNYLVSPQASWGYEVSIEDADGYQYRYLHINNDTPGTDDGLGGEQYAYAPGITEGASVTKGQLIGWVGDSGNAENVTPHLHFEMYAPDRTRLNPFVSLVAAAANSPYRSAIKTGLVVPIVHPADPVITPQPLPPNPGIGGRYIFTQQLTIGSQNEEVRQLQLELALLGYYAEPTATGYFGPATKNAVMKFQQGQGIDPVGLVGPATRAKLNTIALVRVTTPPPVPPVTSTTTVPSAPVRYVFTQQLALGSQNEAVRQLQLRLTALGYYTYPSITGYFGAVTKEAVIKFQRAHGIDPIGMVGPATRAKLNTL